MVELVAIDAFPLDWITPMDRQEKIFAADRSRRLLKNVVKLFHAMDYPQIALSRRCSFNNSCSCAPGYSRTSPFSNLNAGSFASTPS